jgi:hypothetical protein
MGDVMTSRITAGGIRTTFDKILPIFDVFV